MNPRLPVRLIVALLAAALWLVADRSAAAEPNPLLAGVVAVLPDIPLVVQGDLRQRDGKGKVTSTFRVEMVLDWKADVPTARYTIRDAFGANLEHLAITWKVAGQPEYQYFEGQPFRAAALPPLNQVIQGTDITWLDLSLSFLWWPGGEVRGEEKVRGRECHVIDVPAPPEQVTGFNGVRLWVDTKIGIVMRAEGYNEQGVLMRRMDVKSFKKIRDRWVIKDIEFQSFPTRTRTSLLVRDVQERERFNLPDRDSRPGPEGESEPYGEPIDTLADPQPERGLEP